MLSSKQVTVVELESILSKVKKYYKQLAIINYYAFLIISFLEKLKNLTIWTHKKKTMTAVLAAALAIIVYIVMPFNILFTVLGKPPPPLISHPFACFSASYPSSLLVLRRCVVGHRFYR